MKCVKVFATDKIRRVQDDVAYTLVFSGKAEFTTKDAWKRQEKRGKYAE